MKRIAFIALAACALVFAGTTAAFANFGPHGSYASNTDACASCHRAHTATSNITWTDNQSAQKNALLISDQLTMTDFCYACHGDGAVGAATNVESGYFEGANNTQTNSVDHAALNGGGFSSIGGTVGAGGTAVMSSHNVSGLNPNSLIRWGYVNGTASDLSAMQAFTCTDCHDPHGSSNYRLLKDVVNGVTVGGYVGTNSTPNPWVISNEQGYPSGGWAKGSAGAAQVAVYKPNYTSAQYAKNSGKSMSAWCAACHTVYAESDSKYDYAGKIGGPAGATLTMYHRHPIDVPLSVGTSANPDDRALITQLLDDSRLPLEMGFGQTSAAFSYAASSGPASKIWDDRGNISCLTCHRAHGTEATMAGWAATPLGTDGNPDPTLAAGKAGVDPTFDAALLRLDNRGVCEACHNK